MLSSWPSLNTVLILSRARSVSHQSVWSLACQDHVAGGHAGVGAVSLGGADGSSVFCYSSV